MAQRLKTCQFAFPMLASLTNNTLTNLTQISVFIPESSITIRRAWVDISMDDITTASGDINTKTVDLRLGAASYSTTGSVNNLANTGENISLFLERDFTSYFQSNWSGTSMTCDVRLQINQSSGTTLGMYNVCCILNITYEYDDASATHLKTVWIPLNAPSGALPTVKTSHDTIPALNTYLPEDSKTYRDIFIVNQFNTNQNSATTYTINYELSSLGPTGIFYSGTLATDRWSRFVWDLGTGIATTGTYSFNVHSSTSSRQNAMQSWMCVTYEFNPSSTTGVMNSILLPIEIQPAGNSALLPQRSIKNFYVQESGVSLQRLANYLFWQNAVADAGIFFKIGSGSYFTYTIGGANSVGGNKGAMIRNDTPSGISFGRGKNTLFLDTYNTQSLGSGLTSIHHSPISSLWMVNYTSNKHPSGVGAHNHTVLWPIHMDEYTSLNSKTLVTGQLTSGIVIPETDYFIAAYGLKAELMWNQSGSNQMGGFSITAERVSGVEAHYTSFEKLVSTTTVDDVEVGLKTFISENDTVFKRYSNDWDTSRLDIEKNRKYVAFYGQSPPFLNSITHILTYHSIGYKVSGNITNSNGGTVNIDLHRYSNKERLTSTSRVGNGAYTLTWFDNTEPVYCVAYENNTYKGMSGTGIAS